MKRIVPGPNSRRSLSVQVAGRSATGSGIGNTPFGEGDLLNT